MDRVVLVLLIGSVLGSVSGRFSFSSQSRRDSPKSPYVITLDEDAEQLQQPREVWEEAKREKRQTGGQQNPAVTAVPLDAPNQPYAVVHWDGLPKTTVFVLTVQHSRGNNTRNAPVLSCKLWRSLDYGVTFTDETGKWPADAKVNWYYISQHDDRYIIFTDIVNNRLYVTEDEGDTYATRSLTVTPFVVKFVPEYASWLGSQWAKNAFVHDFLNQTIVVTDDLFVTSQIFNEDVTEAFWDTMESDAPGTIFFDSVESESGGRKVLKKAVPPYDPVLHVEDYFTQYFDSFWLSYNYIFVVDDDHQPNKFFVSYNRSAFKQAEFPSNLPGKHYALVDASEGQVFVAAYHDLNNTALYISEEEGRVYSLSLSHLISSSEASWESGEPIFDLDLVEGLKGVLFANLKNPSSQFGVSVVSYDKGGRWDLITPPSVDKDGNQINCVPPSCSLHLHMDTSANRGYNGILSRESAQGLLMAMGNIGSTLNSFSSQIKVYLSTNGGYTWTEVDKPYSIVVYQFLDFGSVMAYCNRWVKTNEFKYSCDEGLTWTTVDFPSGLNPRVAGMLTEPGQRALHATIFGYTYSNQGFDSWYIIGLNFTQSMSKRCDPSDYTFWSPTDEHLDQECLLGEHEEFERRNTTTCCYNGLEYERPVNTYQCNCSIEDYECDYGFQRSSINDPCVIIPGMNPYLPPPDCPEGGTYSIGSGYRKVSGDVCREDPNSYLSRSSVPCPVDPPGQLNVLSRTTSTGVNQIVEFILTQESGGKVLTNYTWQFGDNSEQILTGYDQAKAVTHIYSAPGLYNVTVVASNMEGRSIGKESVLVLDAITGVQIQGPRVVVESTPVLFSVQVQTAHGMPYRPAQFTWSIDSVPAATTASPTLYRSYAHGVHMLSCTVGNANGPLTSAVLKIVATTGGVGLSATILADKSVAGVGENVTFTVRIENITKDGATETLQVHVVFTDQSSRDATLPAQAGASLELTHAFATPGAAQVHLTVTSTGTADLASSAATTVEVRRVYKSIGMYRPAFAPVGTGHQWSDLVNSTILFEFRLYQDLSQQHPVESTDFGSTRIQADFGDGSPSEALSSSVFYHTYSSSGNFSFSLSVSNQVSAVNFQGSVHISGIPSDVSISGPELLLLTKQGVFSVTLQSSTSLLQDFLSSLSYEWTVYSHKDTSRPLPNLPSSSHSSLHLTFPAAGLYEVKAMGYRLQSASERQLVVSVQTTVTVRDAIQSIQMTVNPTVAIAEEQVRLIVQLFTDRAQTVHYNESVAVTLVVRDTATAHDSYTDNREPQVFSAWTEMFSLTNTSVHSVTVTADNGVSKLKEVASVTVVEAVGPVVLVFDVPTIGQDRNGFWMSQFEESIRNQLTEKLAVESWRLRVKGKPYSRTNQTERIAAEVSVLPQEQGEEARTKAAEILEMVRGVPQSHTGFNIPEVTGSVAPVLAADTDPTPTSKQPSTGVIAAIVVCAVIIVASVVLVMSVIIYSIYRKYRRLEMRYSRLTQTAHMTFEAAEDDDDDLSPEPESPTSPESSD